MIRVAIVEDNAAVQRTLRDWVSQDPALVCVCTCSSSREATLRIPESRPDVVLMDIQLPGESGIACTGRLKRLLPALRIIMVTVYRDNDRIFQALKSGACGYLLKRSSPEDVLRSIHEVMEGGSPMTPEIARMVVESFQKPEASSSASENLTARENEILALVARGCSNKEVGVELNISFETVRNHLRHIYEKLHVRSRTEATRRYLEDHPS
jgi:DNA-binding NarL/FixJ family response regulator